MTTTIHMGGDGELRLGPAVAYAVELEEVTARDLRRVAERLDLTPDEALVAVIRAGLAALRRPAVKAVRS